ncbi:MAG: PIN domain-containing protein [Verrucomicrobia bacterium]|nr:PIN domain-containing protein [Verrucomicrobiota bacterium]
MGLTLTSGQTLFLDSAPLIYFFEENDQYVEKLDCIFEAVASRRCAIITSMITYIELLTLPEKMGDRRLAAKYRECMTNSEGFSIYPLNLTVADGAVELRARYGLRTPDAIQLSTARVCGADFILTNDRAWKRVSDLNVVLVDEL